MHTPGIFHHIFLSKIVKKVYPQDVFLINRVAYKQVGDRIEFFIGFEHKKNKP